MSDQIRIGHYILGKTLGTGGFAKVKVARHDLTGLEVAVKIINKKKMKNKNMISKVKRQIRILKFINHPNIIKLYEVLDTTNDIFVIMELASNGELYEIVERGLNEDGARFYFKQIIDGVQYIHRNHISHRDLKPENILIDSNNLIKIGDFGLSNLMKDGKLMKTACGSPFYAAPEIVGQRKYEGTSVDIWSSGVILYTLIVGSQPFNDDNITLLYRKIQKGSYTIPNTVNPLAQDLIRRMLQVDPCKRITIPEIQTHPWMRTTIPIYMKLPDQFIIEKDCEIEIDEEIFERIKSLDLNFHDYPEQKIKKAILKRDDESFAIAYELLKSDKDRREYAEIHTELEEEEGVIVKRIQNTQLPVPEPPSIDPLAEKCVYGKKYEMNARALMERMLKVFKTNQVYTEIKSADFLIKCVCQNNSIKKKVPMEDEDDEDYQYISKKEDKFNKNVIKFTAQVYEVDKKHQVHMVDLHLTQGHPLVFFPIAAKIYRQIAAN